MPRISPPKLKSFARIVRETTAAPLYQNYSRIETHPIKLKLGKTQALHIPDNAQILSAHINNSQLLLSCLHTPPSGRKLNRFFQLWDRCHKIPPLRRTFIASIVMSEDLVLYVFEVPRSELNNSQLAEAHGVKCAN